MMKVAQCWDDGVATDARVVDILRRCNAKATFNLCPGTMANERIAPSWVKPGVAEGSHKGFRGGRVGLKELVDVYGDFQVASHCWKHETAGRVSDEVFFKAAMDARKFLEDAFQRPCPGFAWPCGEYTPETVQMLREAGFKYGRTCENTDDVTKCANPLVLPSSCHFQAGDFWAKYEAAKKTGVFYFWGHSYEMFEYDMFWRRYEETIRIISADPDAEWVDVIDLAPLCGAENKT